MSEVRIAAEPRTRFGKGGARATRRAGQVPAVLYGHGTDVRHIALPARELMNAFKHEGANVLLTLEIPGDGDELALPRQVQRDPIRGNLTHVDLLVVKRGEKVQIDVPIITVGEVKEGLLETPNVTLSVEAEATHLPSSFEINVGKLRVGQSIHASQVKLPEGTTLLTDPDAVVAHIMSQITEEQFEAELAGAVEEAAATGAHAEEAAAEAEAEAEAEAAAEGDGESGDAASDESAPAAE
ncbi:MAG: 50S ribosomal protein L25/general stress protein Ctc [Mycobacteriales bacterium]